MDHADLSCEKIIISDLVLSKKTNSDVSFSFLVFGLLAMLRFNSDFCPSWIRKLMSGSLVVESAGGLLIASVQLEKT
ncbi:unnamed protein product [Hymenolepis diminuta]|uniref:Uncharacterized protein n=1 Tax=Hymenolepis diminuta TaxID=6216 RepID=A0A564Z9M1_HYMDI|nr:unnamed protein product [Hymenolepis diminuta]